MTNSECCVCYSKFKNSLRCKNGKHPVCCGCVERGNMLTTSSTGWPVFKWRCPVCGEYSFEWTSEVADIKLAPHSITSGTTFDVVQLPLRFSSLNYALHMFRPAANLNSKTKCVVVGARMRSRYAPRSSS